MNSRCERSRTLRRNVVSLLFENHCAGATAHKNLCIQRVSMNLHSSENEKLSHARFVHVTLGSGRSVDLLQETSRGHSNTQDPLGRLSSVTYRRARKATQTLCESNHLPNAQQRRDEQSMRALAHVTPMFCQRWGFAQDSKTIGRAFWRTKTFLSKGFQ